MQDVVISADNFRKLSTLVALANRGFSEIASEDAIYPVSEEDMNAAIELGCSILRGMVHGK